MNMLLIVDPMYEEYVNYLRVWRAQQMDLFGREGIKIIKQLLLKSFYMKLFSNSIKK